MPKLGPTIIAGISTLTFLGGCTVAAPEAPTTTPSRTVTQNPATTPAPGRDLVPAYQAIIRWFYEYDTALNQHLFAIDAKSTGLSDPDALVTALKADPLYAGHEIMNASRAELEASGKIKKDALYFPDGFLIEFSRTTNTDDTVTAKGEKWVSGTGAVYVTITAHYQANRWVLDEPTDMAIS
jgi:hypothetical protein